MSTEDYEYILKLAERDVIALRDKGKSYGSSWRKRGGVGAFMMLARKWDRIENMSQSYDWDIFKAIRCDTAEVEGILDDIQDLRRYLLLVESHIRAPKCGLGTGASTVKDGPAKTIKCDHLFTNGVCAKCGEKMSQDWENGDSYAPS